MAIEKYNTDLSALTKTCEEMKKLYSVMLVSLDLLFQYLFCTALEMDRPPFQSYINGPVQLFVIVTPRTALGEYIYFTGKRGGIKVPKVTFFPQQVSFRVYTRTQRLHII